MLNTTDRALHNLLEPATVLQAFRQFPPQNFSVLDMEPEVLAFSTSFDLLTTMEPDARKKLEAMPFASFWRRFTYPNTCFIGTTVSEYTPLPSDLSPETLVRKVLSGPARQYPFLIIKDLPVDPVLVGNAAYDYARHLAQVCSDSGYVMVEGQALAYVPMDFTSIDEYMARLSRGRRKDLRRKLKSTAELDIEIIPTGAGYFQDDAVMDRLYRLYLNVYEQSEIHFDLLSADFFRAILRDSSNCGQVFMYRSKGELIGYNICFIVDDTLLDKYVGFVYPQARNYNLYAVSWFRNLEYALENNLKCYIAGWTDPEIKRNLGARFTQTRHAVYVRNPVLRKLLLLFKRWFEADYLWQSGHEADPRS